MVIARVEEVRGRWGTQPSRQVRGGTQPREKQWSSHEWERCGAVGHTAAGGAVVIARVGEVRGRWGTQPSRQVVFGGAQPREKWSSHEWERCGGGGAHSRGRGSAFHKCKRCVGGPQPQEK